MGENPDEQEIQNHTGLTKTQFSRLKEPPLGYFRELSDRHGINIIDVDCNAELSSESHPRTKIKAEIEKLMPRILELYAKKSLNSANIANPEFFTKFEKVTLQLLQYSAKIVPFEIADIMKAITEISSLERESGNNVPSTVYITASSLFETLATRTPVPKADLAAEYYGLAIKMLTKPLNIERDPSTRAKIQYNLGNVYVRFSEVTDQEENLREAIKVYHEALALYTKENHPTDYAATQNNLGGAYLRLSEITNKEEDLKEAIKAYHEALTIRTKQNYPISYAATQNNLGWAYLRLSEITNKEEDLKATIKACQEALTIYTAENYPIQFTRIQEALKRIAVLNVFASLLSDLK